MNFRMWKRPYQDRGSDRVCADGRADSVRVKRIGTAKHIFSHVEWHMTGYELLVDELEKNVGYAKRRSKCVRKTERDGSENIFVKIKQLEEEYAMPSAFDKFVEHTRFS